MTGPIDARGEARDRLSELRGRRLVVRIASWLVVAIPAVWGVAKVVANSLALFR